MEERTEQHALAAHAAQFAPPSSPPDLLTIGHITRDVHEDGSFSLGGTVSFASLTASRLGASVAIVTRADAQLVLELPRRLPGIGLAVAPSDQTTTFDNRYHEGFRTQYLLARGDSLFAENVPPAWRAAPIVLLAPLAQEIGPDILALFPRHPGALIAATPQGWLRRWDADGRVWPTPWKDAEQVLPRLDALILSHDDLLPFANGNRAEADAILTRWSHFVPLLVATDGRHGATLFQQGRTEHFPAYSASELDPTGAGDVFAAAFLVHLSRHANPRAAIDFANAVASLSIEHEGISGVPTLEQVQERQARGW
ncbi:MAG TPA: PfkB family carbohydrate kinase [Ktedonobacteraceae bacterium]|nr:PfkB family carbohydrate kinase [Ktedonobacteraceae bacterium]